MVTKLSSYEELANAIVISACNDYFTCERKIKKGENKAHYIRDCKQTLKECKEFFNSDWYKFLTNSNEDLNGSKVMSRLDELVNNYKNYPSDYKPFKYGKDKD